MQREFSVHICHCNARSPFTSSKQVKRIFPGDFSGEHDVVSDVEAVVKVKCSDDARVVELRAVTPRCTERTAGQGLCSHCRKLHILSRPALVTFLQKQSFDREFRKHASTAAMLALRKPPRVFVVAELGKARSSAGCAFLPGTAQVFSSELHLLLHQPLPSSLPASISIGCRAIPIDS